MMTISRWTTSLLPVSLTLAGVIAARGDIAGPYVPDADTLHLWHLNEQVVPVVDVGSDGTHLTALRNGATLGSPSWPGFGLALSTYDGGPDAASDAGMDAYLSARPLVNDKADNLPVAYAGPTGAFTHEALVRIDFDPQTAFGTNAAGDVRSTFMQILNFDADEATNRACQFRLVPVGVLKGNPEPLLEFINLGRDRSPQSLTAKIPTTGPDAINQGSWYHVAVTYDGSPNQPNNLKFYWSLLEPSRTTASLIGSGRMTSSLPVGCQPDMAIGQTGRQSPVTPHPNQHFVGLIDEVRVSGVARSPAQMVFTGTTALAAVLPVVTNATASVESGEESAAPSHTRSATWLIAGALLVIAGLLGWLAFVLKRLVSSAAMRPANAAVPETPEYRPVYQPQPAPQPAPQPRAYSAEPSPVHVEMAPPSPRPATTKVQPPPPAPEERKKYFDDNLDNQSAAMELSSEGFHGVLRKVGLQDLIQMECLNQRSTVLEITTEKLSGRIYMERGEILHATAGNHAGEKAFIKLFSLRGGEFNLKPFERPEERTIHCPWIHLLLEAARQRDEDTVRLTRDKLAFTRTTTNSEDILNMAGMLADHPQVMEILVCSNEGKGLYHSKCRDYAGRTQVCLNLVRAAKSAATLLPLGEFDQIEILRSESKTLIRGDQECHLLIGLETTAIA